MKCLHFVAAENMAALADCMSQLAEGDKVVFIDSGVMLLLTLQAGDPVLPAFSFSLEDLQARGLLDYARLRGVRVLDDRAVARLVPEHRHCLTWK